MSRLDFLDFTPDFNAAHIVNAYDEMPLWSAMFGMLLLDEVPLTGMRSVLDVGCGTGFPLIEIAERLGPDSDVHGIDLWRQGLGRAAEKIAGRRLQRVSLHEGSAATMPFEDGRFDLVVSNLGVNNFDDRAAALRECRRVLRKGGTVALTTNLQGHMHEFYSVFATVLEGVGEESERRRLQAHIAHRATVPALAGLLEGAGLAVTKIVERQASMRFASGTALLNHHFIKLGFLDDWKRVVAGRESPVFERLLDELNASAQRTGGLRLSIPMAYAEATTA